MQTLYNISLTHKLHISKH